MNAARLATDWRQQVERYVRPLYTGLDGADGFARIGELERSLADLGRDVEHDPERLELMVLFHGVLDRLGSLAPGGRWQLFLGGLGLNPMEIASLRAGLERFEGRPATPEEELLHDALLLERSGVRAAVTALLAAGKKRMPAGRAVAMLDAGPEAGRFRTPEGARLGGEGREAAERWIAQLQEALRG